MILILSMDMDKSTDDVIDWLIYFNLPFVRINTTDLVEYKEDVLWSLNNDHLKVGKKVIDLKSIRVGWMRKLGYFSHLEMYKDLEGLNSYSFKRYLQSEISLFRQIILKMENIRWLCHPSFMSVSKITMLSVAKELKIDVPETFIVNNKKDLLNIYKSLNSRGIFKSIGDIQTIEINKSSYLPLTSKLSSSLIKGLPKWFLPSLVQAEIEKDFEIRTFYLDGKFYSAAIFSQLDGQTSVDFRNYNIKKPNRYVPYILPLSIEQKLHLLMVKLKLNTGSIDLIKSKDGIFYFLEINPSGQFGFISTPCNFNLEYEIALFLKKELNYNEN